MLLKRMFLERETKQLNVALAVELHHRVKVTTTQEGISVRAWTHGQCSTILQIQISIIVVMQKPMCQVTAFQLSSDGRHASRHL